MKFILTEICSETMQSAIVLQWHCCFCIYFENRANNTNGFALLKDFFRTVCLTHMYFEITVFDDLNKCKRHVTFFVEGNQRWRIIPNCKVYLKQKPKHSPATYFTLSPSWWWAVLGKEREYQLFILAVLEFRLEKLFPSKYKVWELQRFSSEQLKAAFKISTAVTDAKKLSVLLI